jgi:hypothetical protein
VQALSRNAKRSIGLTLVVFVIATSVFLAQPRIEAVDRQPARNLPSQLEWVGSVRNAADVLGKQSRFKWLMKKIVGLDDRERAMLVPYGIAVDSRGRMLVVDNRARLVHMFDAENRKYKTFNAPRNEQGRFMSLIRCGHASLCSIRKENSFARSAA